MAGINWKDARVQGNEAKVGLAREGTRATPGLSALVVLPLLPRHVEQNSRAWRIQHPYLSILPEGQQPSPYSVKTSTKGNLMGTRHPNLKGS